MNKDLYELEPPKLKSWTEVIEIAVLGTICIVATIGFFVALWAITEPARVLV